jgi:hypothetical protein
MRISGTATHSFGEHLRQVEELLDPIRYDRSIDDAERRRQISDVLATANARALSLRAAKRRPLEAAVLSDADVRQGRRRHRQLGRTG